ncbi:malate dehydrogenase [Dissulfurispira thermophila]|uniref:Malate dehydrogenase n=1 Tax=Dissulfurispira thermophila TaxID=2715679 RepID=A0A7G1H051_9BACT|nr:malate dehydrogenase [Dissulfurispira thermophila]BCB96150.1 malate dehydrogenase [Dissulfurispira thermophila]
MKKKVSVIGAGNVGASLAQMIVQSAIADVVLFDIADGIPQGKALDISEACPLWGSSSSILGTNDYSHTENSDVIVITAGFPRKPGMSRDDLLHANAKVVSDVVENTARLSPNAVIIVVTNPMDVMAQVSLKVSGFDSRKVIGMGGVLDSARFRTFVAWELSVSPEDVEALVLGGHGDLMVPMPRFTTVKGIPITELLSKDRIDALVERTRHGGAEIVSLLKTGSAYYAPAAATYQMVKAILFDEKRMLPCSAYLDGKYKTNGIYTGVPVILGSGGGEKIIEIELNEQESIDFEKSVAAVKLLVSKLNS